MTRASRILYNDYFVAGLIVAISALVFHFSTQIVRVPAGLAQGIQPASFPQGVLVVILALTLMMLFEARRHPLEAPEAIPGLAYKTMAAMIAALAVTTFVDFFLGIIAFTVVCVMLWGLRRPLWAVVFALALHAVLFVLFSTLLHVRFPNGPLTGLAT